MSLLKKKIIAYSARIGLLLYLPMVLIFSEIQKYFFYNSNFLTEYFISVFFPAIVFTSPYLYLASKKCSTCKKGFYSKNPFNPGFGISKKCESCGSTIE